MLDFLLTHTPLLYLMQSLWRDEAFSILAAEQPLATILPKLTFEPPFYYILLHLWMKIVGNGEIATRSLSLVGFTLATIVIIYWSEKLFPKHWLSWMTPLFFFFNPMLLYYAFEVRTYGWYMFFATLALFAYEQKRWWLYATSTILGFYTHTYFLLIPVTLTLHYILHNWHEWRTHRRHFIFHIMKDRYILATILCLFLMSPWMIWIISSVPKLQQSWYFPVHGQLFLSVLGNMLVGYDGTPGYLWPYTAMLSLLLLGGFWFVWRKNVHHRSRILLFLLIVFVPLGITLGVSLVKPLFVNRYVIAVTIAEVLLLAHAVAAIEKTHLQKILAGSILLFFIGFQLWFAPLHAKTNSRDAIWQANSLKGKDDVILAASPLIFFETLYYSPNRNQVFLYNPKDVAFPWYVGDAIVTKAHMVNDLPPYPKRAFLIHENGTFDVVYNTGVNALGRPKK